LCKASEKWSRLLSAKSINVPTAITLIEFMLCIRITMHSHWANAVEQLRAGPSVVSLLLTLLTPVIVLAVYFSDLVKYWIPGKSRNALPAARRAGSRCTYDYSTKDDLKTTVMDAWIGA
jgi:hypothetical protein